MFGHHAIQAIVLAGTWPSGGTIDAVLKQATDSSGSGAASISGKSITTMTNSSDDDQAVINLKNEELDVSGGKYFVGLVITTPGDVPVGGVVMGHAPRIAPASDNDAASAAEIVT